MGDGPLFEGALKDGGKVLSVSDLAAKVKGHLEGTFARVRVQGELGRVTVHGNGHLYCDLKDAGAVLNCVAWRTTVARLGKVPEMGTLVVATGKVTTYPLQSRYQLMIDTLEVAGVGELMRALEALKAKLAEEGLFDRERKKPLPFLPRRIGIVTSPTGAVINDMLHRIGARCPREVLLWPVLVQGASAAGEVAAAVEGFNRMAPEKRPDVLIVARGGGSFEDLMPFNSELVVRAVAGSAIPVISGVGHEPDVTLCDHAADVRAPTPSAAAEMAVPVRDELLWGLDDRKRRLVQAVKGLLVEREDRIEVLRRMLPDPRRTVLQLGLRLGDLETRLRHVGPERVVRLRQKIDQLARVLVAHDPKSPLARGYVYLTREGGMVRSASAPAGPVVVHFADGVREGEIN